MTEIERFNVTLASAEAEDILAWAVRTFPGETCLITSFQASGIVVLHLLRKLGLSVPIFFIDTGYHFPETLEFKARLAKEWNLDVHSIIPSIRRQDLIEGHGPHLYDRDPDLCCRINKVEPLQALKRETGPRVWISAVRRDQTDTRLGLRTVMLDPNGGLRIHPLLPWTRDRVWAYLDEHRLPYNPLYDHGYTSIGCFPPCCTAKTEPGSDERAGRWAGKGKKECGLHIGLKPKS
jgi:phosphoadenosine phosphosulfate reductase